MKTLLLSSLVFVFLIGIIIIPSANALPVSYNTTSINLGLTSVPRNSSSYDVFTLNPDNFLWLKFDNNTNDNSQINFSPTITYRTALVDFWHLDSTLANVKNTTNTLVKIAGTTTYVSGIENNGLSFDGSTYFQPTGAFKAYNYSRTSSFSVSFWMKNPTNSLQGIFDKASPGLVGSAGWAIYKNGGNGFYFEIGKNNTNKIQVHFTSASISDGILHHYVVTYSGSSSATGVRIYQDGINQTLTVDLNTVNSLSTTNNSPLSIGASSTGGSKLVSGAVLDEIRIYSSAVLSSAEVNGLYMVGHYSQSHEFDNGETISYGSTSSFKFLHSGSPFTISLWDKIPSGGLTGSGPFILDTANGGGAVGTGITWSIATNGAVTALISNGVTNIVSVTSASGVAPTDNTYHYYAITFDGTTLTLYVDNINKGSATVSGSPSSSDSTNALYIGSRAAVARFFIGQIDNLKVYPYALSSSQITSDYNSISPISSGKQFMSYYHGISGSSTLTNKLGFGATTTLLCSLNSASPNAPTIVSNGSNIYYECTNAVKKFAIVQNTNSHVYTSLDSSGSVSSRSLFMGIKHIFSGSTTSTSGGGFNQQLNSEVGNVTQGGTGGNGGIWTATNQQISEPTIGTSLIKFNDNSTTVRSGASANQCNINYNPSNTTKSLDSIACDQAVPAMAIKYWNGMMIQKIGGYNTNTTQTFLNSIDASAYKKLLSLPCLILVNETPCITFIATDQTQTDWFVVLTSTHVYYGNAQTALAKLQTHNYALQSYDIITTGTTSAYEIQNPILQSLKLYGPINLNSTVSKAGLFTLPSGYTVKTTSIESAIRTIDPRWTNDATDIPIITSTSSLFPIYLTVSNAPVFSAIKVTNPYQLINSQEAVWAVAQLDSTRTVEFDLPSNVCVNVYVADISVSPSIWNFQGIICASGVNQKTISYTNTLPFTFWTYPWGASDSFTPNTNGLVTTVRHTTAPFSYNIVLKNSTGNVFQNTTYTSNSTIDTQNFNLTGKAKPVSLYINSVTGGVNQIYSAFLGSPISLASTASFFNQYFSYQGFNLLAFIPIIFASMFTRNTIGIGVVLTVLCIATLSWLSVVVIPELDIMIMIVIAIIGLIAYRLTYY